MTTGQMFLTIGGIFLLSLLVINVNKATSNRITTIYSNEAVIEATAIAEGIFEDIQTKSFDEQTISEAITDSSLLTASGSLGPESGENSVLKFDDVDDYNKYNITNTINLMGNFDVNVSVNYVDQADLSQKSSNPTFLKRVTVTVDNNNLPGTLTFERIVSY
jgi:hypothetical protein